jgi:large subunit ribosomal protein L17
MRKFHRITGRRRLFKQVLVANFIKKGKITTTIARAKEIRPIVERFITVGKKGSLASFRTLLAKLPKDAAGKMFYEIAPKYKDRKGGYTRIIKTAKARKRDGSEMAVIEFV